jgi:serine/threonine-protein kinase
MEGASKGQEFAFAEPEMQVLIGRSHACALRLTDDTVSRRHCLVAIDSDGVWVGDLDSLNGTFLNGHLVGQRIRDGKEAAPAAPWGLRPLADGDELRVGNNLFAVCVSEGESCDSERAATGCGSVECNLAACI